MSSSIEESHRDPGGATSSRVDETASAASGGAVEPSPAESRGRLVIADRVVERVAGHAVGMVPHATAAPRRVLGLNVGPSRPGGTAQVDARVRGQIATIDATIAVQWPESVREVASQVRSTIRQQVHSATGMDVDHIDIEVVSLRVPEQKARRVR